MFLQKQIIVWQQFENITSIIKDLQNFILIMTSPRKNLDVQKQGTMFGQLSHIQKQTSAVTKKMIQQIQLIKKLQADFSGIQRQAKQTTQQSKVKLNEQVKAFQEKIKNYLISQKAQYMRFANQINQMIQNSKQINAKLTILGNKFDQFQKNVGI